MRYVVLVERAGNNYSAFAPDVPTCIATGATPQEAVAELHAARETHLELLREEGLPLPVAETLSATVEINAPAA